MESFVPVPLGNPCGVALNSTHVFWGQGNPAGIGRAELDGSNADQDFIEGLSSLRLRRGGHRHPHLLVARDANARSGRANIDGTNVNDAVFITARRARAASRVDQPPPRPAVRPRTISASAS